MKYCDRDNKEVSRERFIELRDLDILIYGTAFYERTHGSRLKLLDPSKIKMVTK